MKTFLVGLLSLITLLQAESLREYAHSKGLRSIPKDFAQLKREVEEPDNKMSRDKIILGKKLFFDKNLSYDRTIACAKCHNLEKGGVDAKPTAIGYKGQENPSHLNSPTVLNTNLGCKACHFGPAVGGRMIQKFPLREYNSILSITSKFDMKTNSRSVDEVAFNTAMQHDFPFPNRGGFMGKDGARKFRVPILRNISKTAPYFHNGMIKSLREAIKIMAKYQVGVNLTPIQLDDLEAFLKSLDGKLVEYKNRDEK